MMYVTTWAYFTDKQLKIRPRFTWQALYWY